jgi:radical SAM superfamily enzyme
MESQATDRDCSPDKVFELIHEYQARTIMWDAEADEYRNKLKKEDAWKALAESINKSLQSVH